MDETAGAKTPAASLAVAAKLPEKAKFTGATDTAIITEVLLTTMRETLEGEAVTVMMAIARENVVEPPAFFAVIVYLELAWAAVGVPVI